MFFFLPTGSSEGSSRRPIVTLTVVALCCLSFFVTGVVEQTPPEIVSYGPAGRYLQDKPYLLDEAFEGPKPDEPQIAQERTEFERLLSKGAEQQGGFERRWSLVPTRGWVQVGWLTNLFVHFDVFHLLGNMLFLWLVGPLLEEAWGRRRFLAFYLSAGVVASLVQFLMMRQTIVSIGGASGAIAGCMGAYAVRFAAAKIRFHYFFWLFRVSFGEVYVPAWICGALWFGRELFTLKYGGQEGVATGAHVGGFLLGALVALAMRALGQEKSLMTVAESGALKTHHLNLYSEATSSAAQGDLEFARERLIELLRSSPDHPGAARLMAELDVRTQRGVARLEKYLRPLVVADRGHQLEDELHRWWSFIQPADFSNDFARKLARRWSDPSSRVDAGMRSDLLESLGLETQSALAKKPAASLSAPIIQVWPASLLSVGREGLVLLVDGQRRPVAFHELRGVFGGVIERALWVDLMLKNETGLIALRLAGTDATLPTLFPSKPLPQAWQEFIAGVRQMAGLSNSAPAWQNFTSQEAFLNAHSSLA
jgi:membrane associated rhomboid family serine protease